ncbi:MAG: LCP family protein [Actinobacteria bacterium]|nr:LCP family protein [Actinomycetota bacterium]
MRSGSYMDAPVPSRKSRRRKRRLHRFIVGMTILVAICLLATGGTYAYVLYRYHQIAKVPVAGLRQGRTSAQTTNILLVGDNSRCALQKYSKFYAKQKAHFGSCSNVGGGRSDVTMVLHLDPATHSAYLLSIPRDLWLPIPGGHGLELRVDDTLNSAEDSYLHMDFGPSLLVKTIEDDLGIPIDHYVELNFYTFEQVVNTLGGVKMYFPTQLKDYYSGLRITHSGCQHLNGTQALALVRARHLYYLDNGQWRYDGTGDLGRIKRSHIFLRVLATEVEHRALSNPLTANSLLGSILPYLKVDSGFTLADMVKMALAFRHVSPNSVPVATLPVIVWGQPYHDLSNPSNYQAPGEVVFPFQPQDQSVIAQFLGKSQDPPWQGISPSSVSVTVLNGSGHSGQASSTAAKLSALGYNATDAGSATPGGNPAETVVRYAPGDISAGEKVLSDIAGEAELVQGTTTGGADVTVVTGSSFAVASPSSASPGSAASPTPSSSPAPGTSASPLSTSPAASQALQSSSSLSKLEQSNLWTTNHSNSLFWWDPEACGPNGGPPSTSSTSTG